MLKIAALTLFGLAVLGWLGLGLAEKFQSDSPPTIYAQPGPIKHRPAVYVAAQDQPRATRISSRHGSEDVPAIDVILRLSR